MSGLAGTAVQGAKNIGEAGAALAFAPVAAPLLIAAKPKRALGGSLIAMAMVLVLLATVLWITYILRPLAKLTFFAAFVMGAIGAYFSFAG